MPDLLIELFSEEIPARMQLRAAEDLKKRVTDGLVEAGLSYGGAVGLSTPRRLSLAVEGLLAASPDLREERKGPKVGAPDKAIEGFLRGAGVTRDQLEERDTPKGLVYFATIEKPGQPAAEIVAQVLEKVIRNFPWPKSMRWGGGRLRWVRPLQSILCILSDENGATVVPLDIDGIIASDSTEGHRFMSPARFSVVSFEDYEAKLKRAHVVLSPKERADHIQAEATNLAFAAGMELVEDKGLLAEVAGLVEWPVVLMGQIGEDFLDLPPEVLQTSMREHQKFFSLRDKVGRITRFITVANRETADQGATILAGNEKVLSARLADARFFWDNDLKIAQSDMKSWAQSLENVTFHNKLGSQGDRIRRIAALSRELAPIVGADADQAQQAAELAKLDLSSQMVGEFPELQGVMGRYYIEASGQDAAIAAVAQNHYSPLGPSDDVPSAPLSVAVALADKLDTLTGFWAIDEKPTGSKDPFALRRAALGVIRLVLENELGIALNKFIRHSHHGSLFAVVNTIAVFSRGKIEKPDINYFQYGLMGGSLDDDPRLTRDELYTEFFPRVEGVGHHEGSWIGNDETKLVKLANSDEVAENLLAFIHDRLKVYLRDQGIRHDIIDACIAMPGNDDLNLLVKRARALAKALETEDGANLVQGFKRANNILAQAEAKDGVEYSYGADVKFAETDSEKALFAALATGEPRIQTALETEDFTAAVAEMAALRPAIDAFFEDVKINADSEVLRRNRLNLLSQIRKICGQVADLTRIDA